MKKFIYTAVAVCAVVGSALAYRPVELANLLVCSNPAQPSQGVCISQTSTSWSTSGETPAPAGTVAYTGTLNRTCGSVQCPKYNSAIFINE